MVLAFTKTRLIELNTDFFQLFYLVYLICLAVFRKKMCSIFIISFISVVAYFQFVFIYIYRHIN